MDIFESFSERLSAVCIIAAVSKLLTQDNITYTDYCFSSCAMQVVYHLNI